MKRVIAARVPRILLVKNLIARCAVCQNNVTGVGGGKGQWREIKRIQIFLYLSAFKSRLKLQR